MLTKIDAAADFIRSRTTITPEIVIILGSGLGGFADAIDAETVIPYRDIPHAAASNVAGHSGRMIIGHASGVPVMVMQGRVHYYEGYSMEEVVFLARVAGRMGVRVAIVTNAAGGVNTDFAAGDLMLVSDHINMLGTNPLRGANFDELGPRFPDLTDVYPESLRSVARGASQQTGVPLREGVYIALSGPTYETPAEVRALRILGADATGMSTVPEATVFAHMNIPVLGISCITNMAAGILPQKLTHAEVMETTARVEKDFVRLMMGIVGGLKNSEVGIQND